MIARLTKRRGDVEWHSYSCPDHGVADLPGATTLIGRKAVPTLNQWFKAQGARAALRNLPALSQMVETSGEDAVVRFLAAAADKLRDDAGAVGTQVHAALDAVVTRRPFEMTDAIAGHVEGARRWLNDRRPEVMASEFMVVSESERYGATGDLLAVLDGQLWILDWKTSKGVYETTALQLAAIARADHGEDGQPVPPATRFGVLHVRADGTELVPFDVGDFEWRALLACRDLFEWDKQRSRKVRAA
jgi:hypothetical protein